jgi:hypothetical protein
VSRLNARSLWKLELFWELWRAIDCDCEIRMILDEISLNS